MQRSFLQWTSFLSIDEQTIATLKEFQWVVVDHIEEIMDAVYQRLMTHEDTAHFYKNQQSMERARQHQKNHWIKYIFAGAFDDEYLEATKRIGKNHHRLGVDVRFYSGAYCIMMTQLARIVRQTLDDCYDEEFRYLSALNKVIFMDMGLATSVYYNSISAELEDMAHQLNFALAKAGEFRDNETGEHIMRMSRMCYALGQALGKDPEWCNMLLIASPLHDVGKIGIPDSVLLKPGKLSADEWDQMKQHPLIGGEIVPRHASEVIQMARRISLTHHEKWDGSGYPVGLRETEIPLEGRIAAICDVFDALLSRRPYKEPWPIEDVIAYFEENKGKHFDPTLVDVFLTVLPEMMEIQKEFVS